MQQKIQSYSSQNDNQNSCVLIINDKKEIIYNFGDVDMLLADQVISFSSPKNQYLFSENANLLINNALQTEAHDFFITEKNKFKYTINVNYNTDNQSTALIFNKKKSDLSEDIYASSNADNYCINTTRPNFITIHYKYLPNNSIEITYCDPKAADFLEVNFEEAKSYLQNLNLYFVDDADLIQFHENLQKSISELSDFIFEGRIKLNNNNIIWIRSCFSIIGFENNEISYSGVIFDITEKKHIANNLHKTNAQLKTLLSHLPSGIIVTNDKSKPIYVNPGFLTLFNFNLTLSDFLQNSPSLLRRTAEKVKDKRYFITKVSKITRQKELSLNQKFEFLNGRFIEIDYVPINQDDEWIGHMWICRDVTDNIIYEKELLQAKEAAENSERTTSAFLASMSHELRTPLNGILGCSDAILDITEDQSVKRMAHIVELSGRRLLDSLNSILDLSALQAGKIIIKKTLFCVNELVEDHVSLFRQRAHQQKLTLTLIDDCTVYLYNDLKLLNKILDNLTNNAIKFTRKGGVSIHLTTEEKEEQTWLKISVSDTGIGIKEENQHLIFEAFRQVSEGYRREFDGTGLGLNLTQQYLKIIGGTISLSSVYGEGSTFTILIPGVQSANYTQNSDSTTIDFDNKSLSIKEIVTNK
jgi:signal transduction histidine kinase